MPSRCHCSHSPRQRLLFGNLATRERHPLTFSLKTFFGGWGGAGAEKRLFLPQSTFQINPSQISPLQFPLSVGERNGILSNNEINWLSLCLPKPWLASKKLGGQMLGFVLMNLISLREVTQDTFPLWISICQRTVPCLQS